ncbi:MAG: hypothetical protein PHC75_09605 [Burkholderiales bacterium]|nr:hypothetical protein [Burkholderiales bacterium]
MRIFSNKFRESLSGIRELNSVVIYQSKDSYYILTSENSDELLTELTDYLATEKGPLEYDKESINNLNPVFNVKLLKTVCKTIQIDCKNTIVPKTWLNAKIGVKVDESYEYMDYGNFYIVDKPIYQADTKSYLITAYDKMIESMIKYDDRPLKLTYPITHKNLVIAICKHLGWKYNLGNYPNYNKLIEKDIYIGKSMTYRDILDDLCVATSGNFLFTLEDVFTYKTPTETNEVVNDYDLKNSNVNIGKKYGPINMITFTDGNDVTTLIGQDEESIGNNGLTEINIINNKLLANDTDGVFFNELFNAINGLEYYTYDVDTAGLLIFEPLDRFTIDHDGENCSCVMFNDDIKLNQGLVETTYTDEPEDNVSDFTSQMPTTNQIKNAVIKANKSAGQIILKVNSDGKVVQVELNTDAENGTEFNVKADNIDFESYTFNLATKDISIISDNIDITNKGIQLKNGATIANQNGLISMLQFQCSGGENDLGWWEKDYNYDTDTGTYLKHGLQIHYNIPENFQIISAYVQLAHIPTINEYETVPGTGYYNSYARNIKLYQCIDFSGLKYERYGWTGDPDYSYLPKTALNWDNGTWDSDGYTGDVNNATKVTTGDIKTYLESGSSNMLLIDTDDFSVSGFVDSLQKTARATATLYVIGYLPFTN